MFRQYREFERGEFVVVGGDLSAGGRDRSCCQFISKTRMDVPLVYHSGKLATEMTNEVVPVLEKIYDVTGIKPLIGYERNNGGVFEMERVASMNRLAKFELFKMPVVGKQITGDKKVKAQIKYGWDTTSVTRPAMLTALKEAVDKKIIRIYDKITIEEMYSFIVCQTSSSWKAQAESTAHDDCVMALAIAWQICNYSPTVFDKKRDYGRGDSGYSVNPMTA